MSRPIIPLEPAPVDRAMDMTSYFALILLIGIPLFYYDHLPESLPQHFNAEGVPDAYGDKSALVILALVGLSIFGIFTFLEKIPHHYNYPREVTETNAASMYRSAVRLMKSLKMVITGGVAYIIWRSIQTALGEADGLGPAFLPVFLLLTFALTGYFTYRVLKS